ncbi:hypothetical protein AHMF7616_04766 [Adhaeribacter pallidiroseus]|uniref:Uncharacterized protein n=1 Tax=Adhaeribacter pallidiroseus TaxID=2072847 RepID=A0A369QR36_9BACT|nr:hypothetical protein AHMF7616_04766 [Adhaeribacter pallidiroseus]
MIFLIRRQFTLKLLINMVFVNIYFIGNYKNDSNAFNK